MDIIAPGLDDRCAEPHAAGLTIRCGAFTDTTARLAPGIIQGNIVILRSQYAGRFAAFCRANHQACPLRGISLLGDPALPALGEAIDMRRDLRGYLGCRDGVAEPETTDITAIWSPV